MRFSTVGLKFYKEQDIDIDDYISSLIGKTVILQHDTDNIDSHAIAVTLDGKVIGYVRRNDIDENNIYGYIMGCYHHCHVAKFVAASSMHKSIITEVNFIDITPMTEKEEPIESYWRIDALKPEPIAEWRELKRVMNSMLTLLRLKACNVSNMRPLIDKFKNLAVLGYSKEFYDDRQELCRMLDDIDSQTLVQLCTLNPELRMVLLFGNDHVALMDKLIKGGCSENRLMTVVVFMRMIKQLHGRKMKERNEVKLVRATGEDRDNRFLYATNKVIEEGLLKYGYDWTWIELYCEGAITDLQFNAPKSFLDYLWLIGVQSLPDRTSLAKKIDVVRGEYPNWTFTDTSSPMEIKRRILVVGRFIFHYNNFSRI